ncbi:MAG: hypothetical protein HDS24_03570 [Bacteroides sp.]|nr:hypothetical protein [Bacteroidales bacterium]MBD5291138.1 hypothetical protein [Bacteroides sp.]MDE6230198.1 PepSY-like domain-containing protein [Muribaculaceae bacterium]
MKKLFLTLAVILGLTFVAGAKDEISRDINVLPKAAQTELSRNFKSNVNLIKVDRELGRVKDYEVILTDGTEIKFDRNGNWEEIEVGLNSSIPSTYIPSGVAKYVKEKHPGQKIVGVDKERSGYDVELGNGIELKFNAEGKFLRYD